MFNFFKKKSPQTVGAKSASGRKFAITGMHCGSCAMNIDAELEDLPGVTEASTSYRDAVVTVTADDSVSDQQIIAAIQGLGYEAAPK